MVATTQQSLVTGQFGPQAMEYVNSAVHAGGADLDAMTRAFMAFSPKTVLDTGCGGGHVSFAASPHTSSGVVACDLSGDMLSAVEAEAARRGITNISTVQCPAEKLPFSDASFCMVASRFSAHHWADVPEALRQAWRVCRPGGMLVLADVVAPSHTGHDTFLQSCEMLRDPSHIRDYSIHEWCGMITDAGFSAPSVTPLRLRLEFSSWIRRMRTPPVFVEAIRALQATMPQNVRAHFAIEDDGSFTLDTAVFIAGR